MGPEATKESLEPRAAHRPRIWVTVLVLFVLAACIALARVRTYGGPPDRDVSTYSIIAQELRAGRPLYSDLWDHKPPAIYWTYACVQLLSGTGPASFYLLFVAASIVTMLGVYAAASAHPRWPAGGLCAVPPSRSSAGTFACRPMPRMPKCFSTPVWYGRSPCGCACVRTGAFR
jgi:hypothetical protein